MKKTLHLTDAQLSSADYRNIITLDGVNITDSDPYLYVMLNIPRRKAYAGLSYATGKTHCRAGRDHTVDFYSGSPTDMNHMNVWLKTDPPEHFVKVIVQNFPVPDNYARWGEKRRRQWLNDNLGQGERELIAYIRDKWGDMNKDDKGVLTNVGDGGLCGGQFTSEGTTGENNHMYGMRGTDSPASKPVIEMVTGKTYGTMLEAVQDLGTDRKSIYNHIRRNREKISRGQMLTATVYKNSSVNGVCIVSLDDFTDALNKGTPLNVVDRTKRGPEVVRLIDEEGMSTGQVGRHLCISQGSAYLIYRDEKEAMGMPADGPRRNLERVNRERSSRNNRIVKLRNSGKTFKEVGDLIGIHEATARETYIRTIEGGTL